MTEQATVKRSVRGEGLRIFLSSHSSVAGRRLSRVH